MSSELPTQGRIVVGTDGSERAEKAVQWAAERAGKRRLPLLIVQVIPRDQTLGTVPSAVYGELPGSILTEYQRDYVEQVRKRLTELAEKAKADNPDLEVETAVVEGKASVVLAEASRDADLVVVGARGATAPRTVKWLGGVSDAIVTHSQGPIAVITDEAHENPKGPVVVGVDDSEPARVAARLAFRAADTRGVPVVVVYAYTYGPAESAWDPSVWDPSGTKHQAALTEHVKQIVADAINEYPDVPVEVRVVRGRPQEALVEASDGAGLVVVGSRGRGGFRGLLLGSTSKHVLRESHSPVIVTRG